MIAIFLKFLFSTIFVTDSIPFLNPLIKNSKRKMNFLFRAGQYSIRFLPLLKKN